MRLLLTLCLGLCIIALQVVLGARAFFPDAFADKTDVLDTLMEQKKSVLDQLPPAELAHGSPGGHRGGGSQLLPAGNV